MASLDMGSVTCLKAVMTQLKEQHPRKIIMAPDMEPKVLFFNCKIFAFSKI